MRIIIGGCAQEISSFNPVVCEYEFFRILHGEEVRTAHQGQDSTLGGAISQLQANFGDDLQLVFSCDAEGAAAGPLRHSAFQRIAEHFLAPLRQHAGQLDGAYFALHGAMATTVLLDPEGFLLQEARAILGAQVPMVISLDLHGILTRRMLDQVDGVTCYRTYPHVDFEDTGRRAAQLLTRILRERVRPVAARVRIPALVRGDELITDTGAFGHQVRAAAQLEEHPSILSAGFLIGNPFTDVPELCCQAFVYTNGQRELAARCAQRLAVSFWPNRELMQGDLLPLREAVARGAAMTGPVAFTDAADAPSSGAPGDSNAIIAAMLEADYPHTILAPLVDPVVAAKAHQAGLGASFHAAVGGTQDPRFTPLERRWTVRALSDARLHLEKWKQQQETGPAAVLESGVLTLVVTSKAVMLVDRALFFAHGLDPADFHSTIVKSPHCEPQFFDDWVQANLNVDAPGATSANLPTLGHRHCSRPIFPLDAATQFHPQAEIVARG